MSLTVSVASGVGTSGTIVSKPVGGWNSGNWLIGNLIEISTGSGAFPVGWATLYSKIQPGATSLLNTVGYIQLSGAGPASYTFGIGSSTAIVLEYNGATQVSGIDQSSSAVFTSGSSITWTSVNNSKANEIVTLLAAIRNKTIIANPSGYTEEISADFNSKYLFNYGFDALQNNSGSTGSPVATISGTLTNTGGAVAVLVSFLPINLNFPYRRQRTYLGR